VDDASNEKRAALDRECSCRPEEWRQPISVRRTRFTDGPRATVLLSDMTSEHQREHLTRHETVNTLVETGSGKR
jgi:hypothetical protein